MDELLTVFAPLDKSPLAVADSHEDITEENREQKILKAKLRGKLKGETQGEAKGSNEEQEAEETTEGDSGQVMSTEDVNGPKSSKKRDNENEQAVPFEMDAAGSEWLAVLRDRKVSAHAPTVTHTVTPSMPRAVPSVSENAKSVLTNDVKETVPVSERNIETVVD